jgi:cell division protein FtsQ
MRRWLRIAVWVLFAAGTLFLMRKVKEAHENRVMEFPDIILETPLDNVFLSAEDVKERLKNKGIQIEQVVRKDLQAGLIEQVVMEMPEIEDSRVYLGLDGKWTIKGKIRNPIARIFNTHGESFYLDDKGEIMPLSPLYTARVLPVTGNIRDRIGGPGVDEVINNDSLKTISKLPQTYAISNYVCNDPFLRAQITQIHIEDNGDFVLIPRVGMQRIVFGRVDNKAVLAERFEKLKIFYREAMPYAGWGKYEVINLKFKDQIVCTKRE